MKFDDAKPYKLYLGEGFKDVAGGYIDLIDYLDIRLLSIHQYLFIQQYFHSFISIYKFINFHNIQYLFFVQNYFSKFSFKFYVAGIIFVMILQTYKTKSSNLHASINFQSVHSHNDIVLCFPGNLMAMVFHEAAAAIIERVFNGVLRFR